MSFQNLLTTKVGTITPVLCEELMPNETVNLSAAIQAQLPPLASDTFMRCDLKYEAFFVPHRLVMRGFEEWLVPNSTMNYADLSGSLDNYKPRVPLVELNADEVQPGTLADYLGVKSNMPVASAITSADSASYMISSSSTISVNALPFLAYHRIYDDWYRNTLVQMPIYHGEGVVSNLSYDTVYSAANSKFMVPDVNRGFKLTHNSSHLSGTPGGKHYADEVSVTALRQRNFGYDRFTSATPDAQNGDAQGLKMTVSNNTASFSIGQLRAANAIQQWLERNNLAGNKLVDYVKANYGANLSEGVAQRAILLGSGKFAVYSKGIYQTAQNPYSDADDFVNNTANPLAYSPAAQFGSAFASGAEKIIDGFTAQEPGYLFVMCTLVPRQTYSTGIDRKLIRYSQNELTDMANPMLQGTGNEPIWITELDTDNAFRMLGVKGDQQVFAYQERYADWKSKEDEVHGLLRDHNYTWSAAGNQFPSLSSFALQSSFGIGDGLQFGSDFLQIPVDYLDQVAAVHGDISKYGCWIDSYFDFKVSMPLARYSLPSLQDPAYEHGEDVVLDRGGKRL
nr:MAG: major capsid protein [Microviridae sp.]